MTLTISFILRHFKTLNEIDTTNNQGIKLKSNTYFMVLIQKEKITI